MFKDRLEDTLELIIFSALFYGTFIGFLWLATKIIILPLANSLNLI